MAGPALSDIQQKVLDRIDDEEIVRLASDLIRVPSFTTEETPCAEWIANYLGDQGLSPELQEIEPGRKQTVARLRGSSELFFGARELDRIGPRAVDEPSDLAGLGRAQHEIESCWRSALRLSVSASKSLPESRSYFNFSSFFRISSAFFASAASSRYLL